MSKIHYVLFVLLILSSCKEAVSDEDLPPPSKEAPATPATEYAAIIIDIHKEINLYRESINLSSLELNSLIAEEAKKHTDYMISNGVISHDNFSDRANRLVATPGGSSVAENVAYGYPTAKAVVTGWLNSSGHRKNIEGNFNITGISAIKDKNGRYYYTQIFLLGKDQ